MLFYKHNTQSKSVALNPNQIRYIALGDSYTIGEGISQSQSYPSLLIDDLKKNQIDIELVANPSVTGYTTQDVIDQELSLIDSTQANFATLLIGVNDEFRGYSLDEFKKNLNIILDQISSQLPNKRIILITIPDYSVSPYGVQLGNSQNVKMRLTEFNEVIKSQGAQRNIPVVDIYPISEQVASQSGMFADDGLHPSGKQYSLWEKEIMPVAQDLLKR